MKRNQQIKFLLVVSPSEVGRGRGLGAQEIQMLYRVDGQLKLLQTGRFPDKNHLQGQIMGIDNENTAANGDPHHFCRQVLAQVEQRGFMGVCCFFGGNGRGPLSEVAKQLDLLCHQKRIPLYLPESYGSVCEYGKILVSSALSGGTLEDRFATAKNCWGDGRVVMDVDFVSEDFLLPAPKGSGEKLTQREISQLIVRENASVFFSKELCARYFTYQNRENTLRFVLFDDVGTLKEKIKEAKQWNLPAVVANYRQLKEFPLEKFGL